MFGHVTFFEFCRCMSLQWHINIFETRIVMESNHAQSTCTSCSQRFVSQRLKFIVHLGDPHHQLLYRNNACFCSRVLTTGALREIKLGTMTKRRVSMRPPVPVGANAVLLAQGAKAWPPAFMKTFTKIQVAKFRVFNYKKYEARFMIHGYSWYQPTCICFQSSHEGKPQKSRWSSHRFTKFWAPPDATPKCPQYPGQPRAEGPP